MLYCYAMLRMYNIVTIRVKMRGCELCILFINTERFSVYKECREATEVTDTVFFDKQLLEFQCALAYVPHCCYLLI